MWNSSTDLILKTEQTFTQSLMDLLNDSLISVMVHIPSPYPHIMLFHFFCDITYEFMPRIDLKNFWPFWWSSLINSLKNPLKLVVQHLCHHLHSEIFFYIRSGWLVFPLPFWWLVFLLDGIPWILLTAIVLGNGTVWKLFGLGKGIVFSTFFVLGKGIGFCLFTTNWHVCCWS